MNKLNFIVVGAQKSGTTALDYYLRQHEEVCMANSKELHYFDDESEFYNKPDYNKYHKNFRCEEHSKVIGEVTPIYMYWTNSIRRIWEYNKKIKLIVILRNPIDRAYSHWNMEVDRGNEELSFSEAIREEVQRTKKALPYKDRVYSYVDRGFYTEQLRNIYRYFDKEQVLVLKNEELKNELNKSLFKISNFLNISNFTSIKNKNIHSREYKKNITKVDFNYLKNIYHWEIKHLESLLDWDCKNWFTSKKIKVLFYRNFLSYSGGHQKIYDYYTHLNDSDEYEVDISFSKDTKWDDSNPWKNEKIDRNLEFNPKGYDIVFLGGMDWLQLEADIEDSISVINLIQHVRHSYDTHKLYKFLNRKAVRICVSNEVNEAISSTKKVNGPTYTIENGHKLEDIKLEKKNDIYILGLKNPSLALEIENDLNNLGLNVICSTKNIHRDKVFKYMASSKISVLLPNFDEAEGFYLPALESMKYSDITIVPDCIGNRNFCKDKINCLMPKYNKYDIVNKTMDALEIIQDIKILNKYKTEAHKTLNKYTIYNEKDNFFKILKDLKNV